MNKIKAVFQKNYMHSIKDVITSFENYMKENAPGFDETEMNEYDVFKLQKYHSFYEKLKKCSLPRLDEEWWHYIYKDTAEKVELWMCCGKEPCLSKDGKEVRFSESVNEYKLLSAGCDYMTVKEFAEKHNVTVVTVRQWIRRGKIRFAKKLGREWLIPISTNKPGRGYVPVRYILDQHNSFEMADFPIVDSCETITIIQDKLDKSKFLCSFENKTNQLYQEMLLNRNQMETLELSLISSGKVVPIIL